MNGPLLAGRNAFVTGAGRGIGRAVALALAREGARLTLLARSLQELEEAAAACTAIGAEARGVVCDVADSRALQAAVESAGEVDVCVGAAAVQGPIGPVGSVDPDDWRRAIEIILCGSAYLCGSVLPGMIRRGRGTIVLFAGGGATAPRPGFSAYAAAKAGVVRLVETVAAEVSGSNVRINAIAPGLVDTRMLDDVLRAGDRAGLDYETASRARNTGEGTVPPELVAELALFLATDSSGTLSGKLISAPHDPWRGWGSMGDTLNASAMYTLRRLDPHTLRTLTDPC